MPLNQIYIGIGNWFIKTPFYELDEEIQHCQPKYTIPYRAEGIPPSEAFRRTEQSEE